MMASTLARILATLPKGSGRPWISKSKDGLLVLKA